LLQTSEKKKVNPELPRVYLFTCFLELMASFSSGMDLEEMAKEEP